jgi:hypothetical protein
MSRVTALALSVLIAAAPLGAAQAQARVRLDAFGLGVSSGVGLMQDRRQGAGREEAPRLMSEAQAQAIAQRRAGGARFVGSLGLRGTTYVFRFERDGQIIDISVDARGG